MLSAYPEESEETLAEDKLNRADFPGLSYSEEDLLRFSVRMIRFMINPKLPKEHVESLCRFMKMVKTLYRDVTYHNWRHGFNVCHAAFWYCCFTKIKYILKPVEKLALCVAAICHDLDHRGCNNPYQKESTTELWKRYGTSTMERHHLRMALEIIDMKSNKIFFEEILESMESSMEEFVELVDECIISTDLSLYFGRKQGICNLADRVAENEDFDWNSGSGEVAMPGTLTDRHLLRSLLMSASDIIAITKPWPIQFQVATVIYDEFFYQGDLEKQRSKENKASQAMVDRDNIADIPKFQIGFINFICTPIYQSLSKIAPEVNCLLTSVSANKQNWQDLMDGKIQPPTKTPEKNPFGRFVFTS